MIGKMLKGSGARGLISYLLAPRDMNGDDRPRADIIGGTFAGETINHLSAEFGQLRALKPRLSKAIVHECLRLPEGDSVPDDVTWSKIADKWAQEMGFQSYVTVCHGDHIHIAASRINPDGSVVSDSHDWKRSEATIRQIEQEFGLTQVERSHLLEPEKSVTHHKAPTRGQIAMAERGEIPPSAVLAELIDSKLADGCTASELVEHLENHGVKVRPNIASTGKVSGMSYELDGVEITAKAMGRGFTWANLEKRGMSYEQDRDLQRIREAGYRAAGARDTGSGDSDSKRVGTNLTSESIVAGTSGEYSEPHLASSSEPQRHGENNKSDIEQTAIDIDADRSAEAGTRIYNLIARISDVEARSESARDARTASAEKPKRPPQTRSNVSSGSSDIEPGSDLERIVILATAASSASGNRSASAERTGQNRPTDAGLAQLQLRAAEIIDRTKKAVSDYLQALPAVSYRLQLVRPNQSNVNLPGQSPDQVMNSVPWLKAQNAQGADIYIRPEDNRYILMDDINPATIQQMKADGYEPAAVMETSKNNYAAWIRIAPATDPEPSEKEATTIAKGLAKLYGGDPAAADYAHVSRLPGFTNRKPDRLVDGKSPFVTLREATGRIATAGRNIIEQARIYLEKIARTAAIKAANKVIPVADREGDPVAAYRSAIGRHITGGKVDWSQSDYRAAQDMILAGWSQKQIAKGIEDGSPDILDRKGKAASDYASRTATNALSSDKVQKELQRRIEHENAQKTALLEQRRQEEREQREAARRAPKPRF